MFSAAELQMACNPEIILTKNRIIEQVYEQFGVIGHRIYETLSPLRHALPEETNVIPKISRGEQYRGLPWVMLDYPRWFNQNRGHLAIRVMFWWGNYFLIQLQVSGKYEPSVVKKTEEWVRAGKISGPGWWIGYPEDAWNFLLPQPGIVEIKAYNWQEPFTKSGIFKLMRVEPLKSCEIDLTVEKMALLLQEALVGDGLTT